MASRDSSIDEHALDCVVAKILAGAKRHSQLRGTGTLVAPGLVLTALHGVADRFQDPPVFVPEGTIELTFVKTKITTKATVVEGCFDPDADWVLLRCDTPVDIGPAPIAVLGENERGPDAPYSDLRLPQ